MDKNIIDLHFKAGYQAGKERTCGKKIKYKSEKNAQKAVFKITEKWKNSYVLEAYPCVFCRGWHIGRKMSLVELKSHKDIIIPNL